MTGSAWICACRTGCGLGWGWCGALTSDGTGFGGGGNSIMRASIAGACGWAVVTCCMKFDSNDSASSQPITADGPV